MNMFPQITMGVYLTCLFAAMARIAWSPKALWLYPSHVRRAALWGMVAGLGEALTLLAGGFWS